MNVAYDRVLERKVAALEVERSRLKPGYVARGRYYCPNPACRAKVKFCPDGERVAHFKHCAGAAKPDCHLFCSNIAHGENQQSDSGATSDPCSTSTIGLELRVLKGDAWHLRLRIPRVTFAVGGAVLRLGPGQAGRRRIQLSAIREGAQRFDVIPCVLPLGITRFDSSVPASVRAALRPSVISAASTAVKAFHSSGIDRCGPVSSRLYWGGRYYLLMSALRDVRVPDELSPKYLARQNGWDCVAAILPERSNPRIEQWCQQQVGLPVVYPKALIEVLVPLSARKVSDEIQVRANDEIVVGLSRRGTEALEGNCYIEGKRGEAAFSLRQKDAVAIRIRTGAADGRCFFIRFESEPGVLVDVRAPRKRSAEPLRLKGINSSGEITHAPFGTLAAHKLLRTARSKRFRSVRLQARVPCQGTVSWRGTGDAKWSQSDFAGDGSGEKYRSVLPEALAELLLRRDLEISISLHAYGSLYASPLRQEKPLATKIPPNLAAFIATQGRAATGEQRESPGPLAAATSLLMHQRYARRFIER